MTEWVVSHGDVEKHPHYETWSLDQILAAYGMDIKEGYETDGREVDVQASVEGEEKTFGFTHRSVFTGEVRTCPRYFGVARTDGRWKRFTENFVAV
jgi:hypothetical protein